MFDDLNGAEQCWFEKISPIWLTSPIVVCSNIAIRRRKMCAPWVSLRMCTRAKAASSALWHRKKKKGRPWRRRTWFGWDNQTSACWFNRRICPYLSVFSNSLFNVLRTVCPPPHLDPNLMIFYFLSCCCFFDQAYRAHTQSNSPICGDQIGTRRGRHRSLLSTTKSSCCARNVFFNYLCVWIDGSLVGRGEGAWSATWTGSSPTKFFPNKSQFQPKNFELV